jgi:hypothetical protein
VTLSNDWRAESFVFNVSIWHCSFHTSNRFEMKNISYSWWDKWIYQHNHIWFNIINTLLVWQSRLIIKLCQSLQVRIWIYAFWTSNRFQMVKPLLFMLGIRMISIGPHLVEKKEHCTLVNFMNVWGAESFVFYVRICQRSFHTSNRYQLKKYLYSVWE